MKKYVFSQQVPHLVEPEKTFIGTLYYELFQKKQAVREDLTKIPTPEFMHNLFKSTNEIRDYCYSREYTQDGILNLYFDIAVNADAMVKNTPEEIASGIVLRWRREAQETLGIDVAPFCRELNSKQIILSIPLSNQGYKALGKIQFDQMQAERHKVQRQAKMEIRRADALRNRSGKH